MICLNFTNYILSICIFIVVPSIPKSVTVRKSSNETMDLDINKGNGGVENYIISFQPVSKAKCAGKLVKRNGTKSMKIDSLSAGTIYNISIISVFNKKQSSPYLMQHATGKLLYF